jgi:putative hemolysin
MNTLMKIIKPLSTLINFISNSILKMRLKGKTYSEYSITEDDLKEAMNLGISQGILNKHESLMIQNVFDFKEIYAKDIMTPRTDIVGIEIDEDYEEIVEKIVENNYSRMPVYEDNLDNVIGIFNVKDFFLMDRTKKFAENLEYLKKPFFTFEYKPTATLFNQMRQNKLSVAIVTDEYGGTEGMITYEDIFEKLVGQISDEYDTIEDEDIVNIAPGKYLIDGAVNIDDINQKFNTELECVEFDSIGGYIIEQIDRFPKVNEVIKIGNLKFTVVRCTSNRIEKLMLQIPVKNSANKKAL